MKTKSAGDGYSKKAIEKTVLRVLGSRTFSHGLAPKPSFASVPLSWDGAFQMAKGAVPRPMFADIL